MQEIKRSFPVSVVSVPDSVVSVSILYRDPPLDILGAGGGVRSKKKFTQGIELEKRIPTSA